MEFFRKLVKNVIIVFYTQWHHNLRFCHSKRT